MNDTISHLQLIKTLLLVSVLMPCQLIAVNINFGPNGCTLQDAIRSANNDSAVGNCSAGSGHDILISPDVWEITLNSRLPTLTSDITIKTTTNSGLLKISGDDNHAVMKVTGSDTDVNLERVWITEGNADLVKGAGIHIEDATVTLDNTIVSFNRSIARYGGGIYIEDGVLDIENSFLEYNQIRNTEFNPSYGGALYAHESDVTITASRFVGNDAKYRLENINGVLQYWDNGFGASVFMDGGELVINDSLFSEKDSAVHGESTVATIANSTFNRSQVINWHDIRGHVFFAETSALTLNHVTMKSAFRIEDSILVMTNSILKGDCNIGESTAWIIDTGNLYNTQGFLCPDTGNLFYYPQLLSLADNGGPTETFALQYTSDAINAGDPAYCLPTDQRGVTRDAACDIGAYEANDFVDVEVDAELSINAPYVHGQDLIYEATIRNNSLSLVNEIKIDLATDNAVITDVDYSLCNAFPCTLNGIQGNQEITIPVHVSLSTIDDDFEFNLSAAATSNSTFTETDLSNNTHDLTGSIEDGADLAVNMELLPSGNHFIGQVIQYSAVVENLGFNSVNDASMEFMPTGLSIVSFAGCDAVNSSTCELGNMLNGSSKNIIIDVQITATEFDATAEVSASMLDINLANNIDLQGNNGALGETNITVDVSPEFSPPFYSYGYMRFSVKITTGNVSASNIRVWESFPGAEFIGCSHAWNLAGYCEVPNIAANSVEFVTFDYFNPITDSGSQQQYSYTVFATPGETDTDMQDNEVTIDVTITATADLAAQLSLVDSAPFYTGQELEFHLRVVNGGLNHANDVEIDVIPENLSLVWMSGNLCQTELCDIAEMERFNEENMVLVYRIDAVGDFSLSANVGANQVDQNNNNNFEEIIGSAALAENDLIFADDFE